MNRPDEIPDLRSSARGKDRRRSQRYDTAMEVAIRLVPDGEPLIGWAREIGPNGIRLVTTVPLSEACYVHVSFENASNNTRCEGRVVWTERNRDGSRFESGIDIQRWGGENPVPSLIRNTSSTPKKDRRQTRR
jgi:hypothetical protein